MEGLYLGDCLEVLKTLPENSIDSVVTDPPYGLSFMGKKWDYDVPSEDVWRECLRVLKPGGHLLAFAGTRTQHRMAVRIEDAGFEIRDMIAWVYGCLSEDTEILTESGYKPLHKTTQYDRIGVYDIENNIYKWERPQGWQVYRVHQDTAYRIKSDYTDQIVSRNHRCVVEREGKLVFKKAEELSEMELVPVLSEDFCTLQEGHGELLLETLLWKGQGLVETIFGKWKGNKKSEERIEVRKEPCLERWSNLLEETRKLQADKICEVSEGVFTDGEKRWICNGTSFDNGSILGDMFRESPSGTSYQSRPTGQPTGKPDVISIKQGTQITRRARVTKIEYSGIIFCPTVSTGAFVARRNGQVFITGNSGFPKSLNIGKAVDKLQGNEREVVGEDTKARSTSGKSALPTVGGETVYESWDITKGTSEWEGWGTALKPAVEPVGIYTKPLQVNQIIAIIISDLWSLLLAYGATQPSQDHLATLNAVASTVPKSARTNLLAKLDNAEHAQSLITSLLLKLGKEKESSVQESAVQSGDELNQATRIPTGKVEGVSLMDISISVQTEGISENTALSLSNILGELLDEMSMFTTETAIRKIIELKTLRYSLYQSISTCTGSENLSPNLEPITVARKPLTEKTVATNVLKWGTGAINVDATRVPASTHACNCGDSIESKDPSHTSDHRTHTLGNQNPEGQIAQDASGNDPLSNVNGYAREGQPTQDSQDGYRPSFHSGGELAHASLKSDQEVAQQQLGEPELPFHCATVRDSHGHLSTCPNYTTPDIKLPTGRWPANLIHDGSEEVVGLFPESKSTGGVGKMDKYTTESVAEGFGGTQEYFNYGDSGSAARFFYCAKASKKDRDEGLEGFAARTKSTLGSFGNQSDFDCPDGANRVGNKGDSSARNFHPTVKPTNLMRYLCRLVTPPKGIVLDPFMGSGSTGKAAALENFRFIGIEREREYLDIAIARIQSVKKNGTLPL